MTIGKIVILFITFIVINGLGFIFLFLTKNENIKKTIFYILSIFVIIVSLLLVISFGVTEIKNQMLCLLFDVLSIIGVIIHIKAKNKLLYNISYLFLISSIVLCIYKLLTL